ncbi:13543_t:CDS:2 [Ambispora gerdemannii]|uniref:13543_t:CDS:1 n=1 Tax=Ambispora gerdemannii TaxID=144530 RepID=A0A9N8VZJ4_9GLOM|nr:13543_t:CDS:2 [Ambispora gerdemannii]
MKIISNIENIGFLIAYLTLNTTKVQDIEEQTELQMKILASFLHSLCDKEFSVYDTSKRLLEKSSRVPDLEHSEPEYYIVYLSDIQDKIINLIRKHFNMHIRIPINAAGQFLTADEIRKSAIRKIYKFCVANNLILLWTYL